MTELNAEIIEKLDGVYEQIKHVQETNDRLEESYDGLDVENIKKNAEQVATVMQTVQDMKAEMATDDYKARLDAIELEIAKGTPQGKAVDTTEYKHSMTRYMRKNEAIPQDLLEKMCDAQVKMEMIGAGDEQIDMAKKELVSGSGPDGGYFIIPERLNAMSTRIFETSPVRQLASVMTTTSNSVELILDDDEAAGGWVGEIETRSTTDSPQVGVVTIPVHELHASPRASQRMLDDAGFDIEGWLNNKVSRKFSRLENTSFVTGSGASQPKGFMGYSAWASAGVYEANAIEQVTATGTAGTLDNGDDLITLQNTLYEDYQGMATWGMQRGTFTDVMTLKDSNGAYLINPAIIKEGTDKILLGAPVAFMSDVAAVAGDALAVVIADWKEFYTIVDRVGVRVLRDPYSSKPYVVFYTTKRVGGAVTNFEAGKILKINS